MNQAEFVKLIRSNESGLQPVVPFNTDSDCLVAMDFTAANHVLTDELLSSKTEFADYVISFIAGAGARYGIGGYAEHRTVYRLSSVFDGAAGEPRRLHLGTDIWGPAGTAVMAPIDGWVHSFAFNDQPGDYGATIILRHELGGISFYTLFGHLGLNDIQECGEGDFISAGTPFARLGNWAENGGWPPHLHFQIILDIGQWKGDYPGVCAYSEREQWLTNSPDPDLILQLNQYIRN